MVNQRVLQLPYYNRFSSSYMLVVWSIEQREEPLNVCKLPNGMLTVDRLGGLDVFGHHHRCFRCWLQLRQLALKWLLRQQTKRLQTFKVVSHYVSNTLFDSRWHPSEGCWLLYIYILLDPVLSSPFLFSIGQRYFVFLSHSRP